MRTIAGSWDPGGSGQDQGGFYVEAQELAGKRGPFPREAPQRTCLTWLKVPRRKARCGPVCPDQARTTELQSRRLHSMTCWMAPSFFDRRRGLLRCGVRTGGSPWGRRREELPGSGSRRPEIPPGSKGGQLERSRAGPTRAWFTSSRGEWACRKARSRGRYHYIRTAFNGGAFTTQGVVSGPSTGTTSRNGTAMPPRPALKVEGESS